MKAVIVLEIGEDDAALRITADAYPDGLNGPAVPLGFHSSPGFGPEEAELGQVLERLDKVLDPTGTELPMYCWWADAWAQATTAGGHAPAGDPA